jgi:hypothetical protein
LYVAGADGSKERRVTWTNEPWWTERAAPTATRRRFTVSDNQSVDGWLLLPAHRPSGPLSFHRELSHTARSLQMINLPGAR